MAENFPAEFAKAFGDKPELQERFQWVFDHKGIGKHPTEIDYEEMYDELMRDV
jgi:hypothetical protein